MDAYWMNVDDCSRWSNKKSRPMGCQRKRNSHGRLKDRKRCRPCPTCASARLYHRDPPTTSACAWNSAAGTRAARMNPSINRWPVDFISLFFFMIYCLFADGFLPILRHHSFIFYLNSILHHNYFDFNEFICVL